MRAFFVVLALGLTACGILDPFEQLAQDVLAGFEVASVQCPDSLRLDINEGGQCLAFNAYGATIQAEGQPVAIWGSDDPSAVSIEAATGKVRAESTPGGTYIIARGANGSSAFQWVTTY